MSERKPGKSVLVFSWALAYRQTELPRRMSELVCNIGYGDYICGHSFHFKQFRRKRPPMRIKRPFFYYPCFLFAEEIHKDDNLLTDKAFLFARKIRSGMSEKPTNQFEDAHDLIFSYIDTKKNIKILYRYKKRLYICSVKTMRRFPQNFKELIKMERTEKIKRFMLMTQMWGYFRHQEPDRAAIVKMNNAIKGDVNFDTLAEAYNRLFLDDNWVQINRKNDLEEYNKLMSMTEEEFAEEFFAVEGYYYK